MGYVCDSTLFQQLIPYCQGVTSDLDIYKKNQEILYNALVEMGYEVTKSDGAFYLFVKALEEDAYAFCERAKKYELLLVPSDDFGCPGFVRIAFCVSEERIKASLPAFRALAQSYGLCK